MASSASTTMTSGVLLTSGVILMMSVTRGAAVVYRTGRFQMNYIAPENQFLPLKGHPFSMFCEVELTWEDPVSTGMVKLRLYKASNNETMASSLPMELPPFQLKYRRLTVTYNEAECEHQNLFLCDATVTSAGQAKPEVRRTEVEIDAIIGCGEDYR
ncbi:hypothetical protein BaRGS_00020328 [Batillaria attramentaria]|uniref:Uncharacterized protein n=1 Tax=Batillaria attramentaria TaxID=370345 RepID=A0ABD0KMB6_9CAEN